jgi:hypothetical protein
LRKPLEVTLSVDDLTLLSGKPVRVPIIAAKYHLVYVFSASVLVPYVIAYLRTSAKVKQTVTAQSTINLDGNYVVPATVGIDGLSLTPSKIGLVKETKSKYALLHFGYVVHWQSFRAHVVSRELFLHEDASLPKQLFF